MNIRTCFIALLFIPFFSFSQDNVIKNRVTFDGDPGKYFLTKDLKIKKWNPTTDDLETVGDLRPCKCPDHHAQVIFGDKKYFLLGANILTPDDKPVGSFSKYQDEQGIVPMAPGWGKEKEKPAEVIKPAEPAPKRRPLDWDN